MHAVEDDALMWAIEFAICQAIVLLFQLLAGYLTVIISKLRIPLPLKYILIAHTLILLSYLSYLTFDAKTHLIGAIVAGLSLAFVTPLQASSHIHKSHYKKTLYKRYNPSTYETILRIAIPASDPTPTPTQHPNVRPTAKHRVVKPSEPYKKQFIRAIICFIISSQLRHLATYAIQNFPTSILTSIIAFVMVRISADGALSVLSAVRNVLGLPTSTPFTSPLLSKSQAAFWAGRWNSPVSDALRCGVANPLIEACGVPPTIAVFMCFIVSGCSHEFILWFSGVSGSKGEWFLFFFLAGFATVLEKYMQLTFHISPTAKRVMAWSTICPLFHFFFVPVTIRTKLAHAGFNAFGAGSAVGKAIYQKLF